MDPSAPTSTSALSVKGTIPATYTRKETLGARSPPATYGPPESLSPRIEARALPTPVKVRPLETLLTSFHDKEFIVNGFTRGFDLGFTGEPATVTCNNSFSVNSNLALAHAKVFSEIKLGRVAGPFSYPPLKDFKCSPLSLREKSTPGKFRLLHNLSYPYNESAVNFNIPDEAAKLKYSSIIDVIDILNQYGNCFLAKCDIKEAYRLIPLSSSCYNLTGFKLGQEYFYDRCLPMGARSACKIFERFSSSLKFILISSFKVKFVVKMLDDFLFVGRTKYECQYALESFQMLCRIINVPLAPEKTVGPSKCVTFLGIQLDTDTNLASVPQDKISSYASCIKALAGKESCTLRELKSMIGKLQFASSVVTPGRCFLRRLHDATIGALHPNKVITLNHSMKADLNTWSSFLTSYNGKTLMSFGPPLSSIDLHLYSDASKSGYGATYRRHFIQGLFPESWKNLDIQVLELYPIVLLVNLFADDFKNKCITIHCDNIAIVYALNFQTSKNKRVMQLLRPLILTLLVNNIRFQALHIPGKKNILCDKLSRQQTTPSLLKVFRMDPLPTPVPACLLPHSWDLL